MKTILLVLGLTAVLFSGVWSQTSCDNDCGPNGSCNETTSMCVCDQGYIGTFCNVSDECSLYGHYCHEWATCYNAYSSYFCFCNFGFTGDGYYCEDFNECEQGYELCGPSTINQCINLNGSYTCNCSVEYGFFYDPNNRTCTREVTDILDLPVELDATIIAGRDGCNPGDIYHYIEGVKEESLEILREGLQQLGFYDEEQN